MTARIIEDLTDLHDLVSGDNFWLLCRVTDIDSDPDEHGDVNVYFEHLHYKNEDGEDTTGGEVFMSALKHQYGQGVPRGVVVGDIVYSASSPGTFGRLVSVIKGQGVVDWSYDSPSASSPALSILSLGTLRRQGT